MLCFIKNNIKKIINFGFLIFILILLSCSTDIKIENYINKTEPFTLIVNTTNSETKLTEKKLLILAVNSDKWKKLVDWGNNNQGSWTSSPASYTGDIYVTQDNFKLTYLMDIKGVVVTFKDKDGNPKQCTKDVEKGVLNFLYE